MDYNAQNLVFIFVLIIIYSSYTYGDVWKSSPEIPNSNVKKNCEGWIMHHGFVTYPRLNRGMALERDKRFDQEVSVWAAGYAYFISSYSLLSLHKHDTTPAGFCAKHVFSEVESSYLALKDAKKTCEGWIYFYGYFIDKTAINWLFARDRNQEDDPFIHVWVAMYSRYIQVMDRAEIKPSEFCKNMGQVVVPVPSRLQFATLRTTLACQEWIELSDYTGEVEDNILKALNQNRNFYPYLSKWTLKYIHYLKNIKKKREEGGFINTYLSSTPMTPESYCIAIDQYFDDKVYYEL